MASSTHEMDTRQIALFLVNNDNFPDNDCSYNIEDANLDSKCNKEALALLSVCFREICTTPEPRTPAQPLQTSLNWRNNLQMEDQIIDETSAVSLENALEEDVFSPRDQTEIVIEDMIADIHRKMSVMIIDIGMPFLHQRRQNDAVTHEGTEKKRIVFVQENVLLDFKTQAELGELEVYGCIFDAVCEAIKHGADTSQLKIAVSS